MSFFAGKLEELRELNRRHETVNFDSYINQPMMSAADAIRLQEERDEEFVQSLYGKKETPSSFVVKRLADDEEVDVKPNIADMAACCSSSSSSGATSDMSTNKWLKSTSQSRTLRNAVVVKKKPKVDPDKTDASSTALTGLAAYGGGSDSDSA